MMIDPRTSAVEITTSKDPDGKEKTKIEVEPSTSGAAKGAAAGAAIGSVVPGFGTAVGAVAGGLIGLIFGPAD